VIPISDNLPRRSTPVGTYLLVLLNVAVFWLQLSLEQPELEKAFYLFGIVPARYAHPEWAQQVGFPLDDYWPFLTSMFLHGGWIHLLGHLWTLWIFADNVEDRMGTLHFLSFYLFCGILAGLVHYLTNPHSTVPAVGASGAIAGVLGAYFLLYPTARIVLLFPIFIYPLFLELPAFFYLLFWFLTQVSSGTLALGTPDAAGGVAWWAHIGGFAAGMASFGLFLKRPKRRKIDDMFRS
jgi:membrane associated rhomboid family serine protease